MKLTTARVDQGPDYTSSPLTIGDRWITWPEHGTPPTIPSTITISSLTTQSPRKTATNIKIPTLNG